VKAGKAAEKTGIALPPRSCFKVLRPATSAIVKKTQPVLADRFDCESLR
jgi:hypothetical protein